MKATSYNERLLPGCLLVLTFVTGLIDAAGFLAMGHVFTANMTGNIVFLGFAFAGRPGLSAARSQTALAFAMLGAMLTRRLETRFGERKSLWLAFAIGTEAALFGASAIVVYALQRHTWPLLAVIALTALAMGVRNGTMRRLAIPEMTTTVLTLTLAALAFDFSWKPGDNPRWQRRTGSILCMLLGAFTGALLLRYSLALLLAVSALLSGASAAIQKFCWKSRTG